MFVHSKSDVLLLCGAFHRAWISLLLDEKLSVQNLEEMPSLLLGAILDAAIPGNLSERALAEAGLARLAEYEKELEEEARLAVN
jgi:hypothetical protein